MPYMYTPTQPLKSPEEIVSIVRARQQAQGKVMQAMREMIDRVNGDIVIGLPEMGLGNRSTTANLVANGLDSLALHCSLTEPTFVFPALDPTKKRGPGSASYARIRRLATAGWWEANNVRLMKGRLFRYLIGTGIAPIVVKPDFKRGIPQMEYRNPLHCFPNDDSDFMDAQPEDCGFAYWRSASWIRKNYPEAWDQLVGHAGKGYRWTGTEKVEVIEWYDCDQVSMLACAFVPTTQSSWDSSRNPHQPRECLVRLGPMIENRTHECLVVVGKRITLDRLVGQFNALFGMHDAAAQLMALDVVAHMKAVFPDIVLIGPPGQPPTLVDGDWIDGRFGVNKLQGGDVKIVNTSPPQGIGVMLDRLERNERLEGGITAQQSGELPTNVQTGRMGQNLFANSVSPRIAEYQLIMASLLEAADKRMMAVAKSWPELRYGSFFVTMSKNKGSVQYDAEIHFETYVHRVVYPVPGMDPGQLAVAILQRTSAGMMSTETGMILDPMIDDPVAELGKVRMEQTERLAFDGLRVLLDNRELSMVDLATIGEKVNEGKTWMEAIIFAQKKAQERQATVAPEGAPETMPGLEPPGVSGVEQPTEAVGGLNPAQGNARDILMALGGSTTAPPF